MKREKWKTSPVWFWLGLAAVLVMLVPYPVLGEEAIVVYHDQLDGEMIAYILQAEQLTHAEAGNMEVGSGEVGSVEDGSEEAGGGLERFMGGVSTTALTPPAPLFVLLFCTGQYFAAYVCMQMLGSLAGYLGMYLLGKEITGRSWVGMVTGVLFAYLPFLPVYGLTQYGIPLLIWCFYQIWKGKKVSWCRAYAFIYVLTSSLVLAGFAVLGLSAVCFLGLLPVGRRDAAAGRRGFAAGSKADGGRWADCGQVAGCRRLWFTWVAMLLLYILENSALLGQMFLGMGDGQTSHKAEYVLTAEPFVSGWLNAFLKGGQHSEDYHIYILAAAIVALFLSLLWIKRLGRVGSAGQSDTAKSIAVTRRCRKLTVVLLLCNLILALVAALWDSTPGILLRSHMEALKGFQMDRVLWLAPTFWYLILACVLGICGEMAGQLWRSKTAMKRSVAGKYTALIFSLAVLVCTGLTGLTVLKESNLKPNLQKLLNPSYQSISYGDYYASDVMKQVREYLTQQTGQSVSDYRVVSLGIDPAAAYYAGFYCLDGYSNNYSLEYKHAFRKVVAPELSKSEYLTSYYDDWGNRCYLVSAECPGYYTIEKGGFFFQNYELDSEALWEMGGRYLLSAAYIQNAEEQGLYLMREEPFETGDSYYRIFVYEIAPDEV